jgi:catechol 2,3-dioxygenase-like lactoylglutathione lyase family enzyme
MDIDHVVLWVESAKCALEFYVDALGLEPVRAEDFAEGEARFPSVRINEATILDIMERSELLPLVREFTGSRDDIGGAPINHICLSVSASEFDSVSERLHEHGVELRLGGQDVFGARGQAVRSVYFDDPDGNVLEMRFYGSAK